MKAIKISEAAIGIKKRLDANPFSFEDMLPCEVKQYSVEDVVVFPDGSLINKSWLVIEEVVPC